jgi:DsrE/DsrF-like family
MRVLHVVSSAYRATFEEQDDTVLWFTQVLRGAGADLALLLQGSAVNYSVLEQDASGLGFGAWRQAQPPNIAGALVTLLNGGVAVYAVEEDLADRGIGEELRIKGVACISKAKLGELCDTFDQVWQW